MAIAGKTRNLGDRPLVVLTHSEKPSAGDLKQMDLTPEQSDRLDTVLRTLHREEATWSTRCRHEVVPRSAHDIQFDQPQTVIAAVRVVVEQVRQEAEQ